MPESLKWRLAAAATVLLMFVAGGLVVVYSQFEAMQTPVLPGPVAAVLAGLTVVACGLCVFIYRSVMTPIGSLVEATRVVDLDYRIPWDRADEFAPLAAGFNVMLDRLNETTVSRERLEASEAALRSANDRLTREISHKTRTAAALEHAAGEWRQTVDAIDASIVSLDDSGRVRRLNRAALGTLDGSYEYWVGRSFQELKGTPWRQAQSLVLSVLAGKAAMPIEVHDREGGETWDIACAVAAPRASGAGSLLVVARNITRVVLLQESLRRSETMAEMGRLVAGVAHEVRSPLFAISAILDAWTARGVNANIAQYQTTLRREIERMRGLMGELLEYGRPYSQELQLGDVATAVTDALAACSALAESRHVTVRYGVSKALIRMDRARLSRVFLNVLENAIQHAPEHTEVVIASCEEGHAFVNITVRDGGPGFEPDSLPRLFTPFFSKRPGGTGLGLAIVQRIIDEHQGRVRADNHSEGGAVITIRLPLASSGEVART